MSARTVLRLAIALGLLIAIWGAVALGSRHAGDPERPFRLPAVAAKDVDTISIVRAGDTAVFTRAGTTWEVNGYRADQREVTELLNALADSTTSGDLVAEHPSSYGQVGVDSASGHRIRVVAGGRTVDELVAGKPAQVYGTGYLKLASDSGVYLARSALPRLANRPLEEWRDHRIGGVARDSITKVEVRRGARHYALVKLGAGWVLEPGGAPDSMAVVNFLSDLAEVRAGGFATPAQADSLKFAPPKRRVAVFGPDGKPRLALVLDSIKSGLWARADSGDTVWRLDQWNADRITPAESTLAARRKR
jgi:uncharacterized protein DUF4340